LTFIVPVNYNFDEASDLFGNIPKFILYRHKHLKISCLIDDVEDIGDGKFRLILRKNQILH